MHNIKNKFKTLYMSIAFETAKVSYAKRLKVGVIAVKDNRILSIGYNGTAPGQPNECELEDGTTSPNVIHAEQNLIYKMARDGQAAKDADIYITHAPCIECAKAIVMSGFKSVCFSHFYRDNSGLDYLSLNGISPSRWVL
jgi:dCMP deaminase